jgi:hypothetical protein
MEQYMREAVGSYVLYKDNLYLVTSTMGNKYKLFNPTLAGINVNGSNTEYTNKRPAIQVTYKARDYLVTGADNIVSVGKCRILKWAPNNGDRIAILALRDTKRINSID